MKRYSLRVARLLLIALSAPFSSLVAATPMYRVIDLGLLPGYESCTPGTSNDDGVVTGSCSGGGQPGATFTWTAKEGMRVWQHPIGIDARNNKGQVAGRATLSDNTYAFVLGTPGGESVFLVRDTWADNSYSSIVGINDLGHVIGRSIDAEIQISPWLWTTAEGLSAPIAQHYPSYYEAHAINNRDQIAGALYGPCSTRAVLYDVPTGHMTFIGPGSSVGLAPCARHGAATALNDVGQVVGWGNRRRDLPRYDLFIWSAETGPLPLAGDTDPSMYDKLPTAINDSGQVVGSYTRATLNRYHYFYWDKDSGVTELEKLIDPNDPLKERIMLWSLSSSAALLTQDGRIVVRGSYKPRPPYLLANRVFMLEPVDSAEGR